MDCWGFVKAGGNEVYGVFQSGDKEPGTLDWKYIALYLCISEYAAKSLLRRGSWTITLTTTMNRNLGVNYSFPFLMQGQRGKRKPVEEKQKRYQAGHGLDLDGLGLALL